MPDGPLAAALVVAVEPDGAQLDRDDDGILRAAATVRRDALVWDRLAVADDADRRVVVLAYCPQPVPPDQQARVLAWSARANTGLLIGTWEVRVDTGDVVCRTSLDLGAVPEQLIGPELLDPVVEDLLVQNAAAVRRYLPGLLAVLNDGADPRAVVDAADA